MCGTHTSTLVLTTDRGISSRAIKMTAETTASLEPVAPASHVNSSSAFVAGA